MELRYRAVQVWLVTAALGALIAGHTLEDLAHGMAPWEWFLRVLEWSLLIFLFAGLARASLQLRRLGRILRLDESGVAGFRDGKETRLTWDAVRAEGRVKPGQGSSASVLLRVRSLQAAPPWLLGHQSLQHHEVLALLLEFYSRNAALRAELVDPVLLKRRIDGLLRREKRRLRVVERRSGTLRVRNRPIPGPAEPAHLHR